MTALELLPCPFCGGEAVLCRPPFGKPYVCCNANFCSGPKDTEDEAIAAWNRRTPSPEVAALIAEAQISLIVQIEMEWRSHPALDGARRNLRSRIETLRALKEETL